MAAIERGGGVPRTASLRAWLAKAVTAPRGMQWVCDACGHIHAEWRPVCSHCDSFDRLSWQEVTQSDAALMGPAQMLPLIVGALEGQAHAAGGGGRRGRGGSSRRPPPEPSDAPAPEVADSEPEAARN